ncbi:ACT domain-containing protein [Desulfotruncus alcoholivorax]|uniref:ACT domain-containing protein n=1 Tax=Desulfotruncus alcoholivorax TaxID=265477 RepID=UPI000400BBE0|nr:ACT domain-containing protein [Desulfotruncus alcoholivorax]
MAGREPRFFLVREDVLPEAIFKTVQAKELLMRGDAANVAEAVEKVSLSRSAFYKYRDKVYPFHRWQQDQTVTLGLILEHRSGVLSALLSNIAAVGGNVVTINQNLPQQGVASATITIETNNLECDVEQMLTLLRSTPGVKNARLLGS